MERAKTGKLPADDDKWIVKYPAEIVGWIVDLMKAFDYNYTPADILDSDHRYPGIWEDISVELWHRKLTEKSEEARH